MKVQGKDLIALAETDPRRAKARARDVARAERRAQAVELRRAGLPYHAIGTALGISEGRACTIVKESLQEAIRTPAEALVQSELVELEMMRSKTLAVLNAVHPLVSGGSVVHDIVRDGKGDPFLDPRTGEPLRLPLHDSKPVLQAIALLERIAESRRRLLGIDAPKKIALTDAAGHDVPVRDMTVEQFEAAVAVGLNRLRAGRADVVDAAAKPGSEAVSCG